jgi:hypothetical protein
MYVPLTRSDYYGASAHIPHLRRTTHLSAHLNGLQAAGAIRDGSRVHRKPIDQLGIQLCPGSIAMATPQTFTMASPPARQAGFGVDRPHRTAAHCIPAHIHQI